MKKITEFLDGIRTICIAGHIRPDGDCVGSSLGLYNYLIQNYNHIKIDIYLEIKPEKFSYIRNYEYIMTDCSEDKEYDLFIALDLSDTDRLGDALKYYRTAKKTLCIDHHISNSYFAMYNIVDAEASSTAEIVYQILDEDKIDKDIATALYTGIIHDTGVFKYSSTSEKTMNIAGKLMQKGIEFTKIIDETYYTKTYIQNLILGRALLQSMLICDGRCIFTVIRRTEMELYGVTFESLSGIVEQLRITKGVECAIFLCETDELEFKVSLRSNNYVDVSKIAVFFGGGGHVKAAGCTLHGTVHDVVNNLTSQIDKQLITAEKEEQL